MPDSTDLLDANVWFALAVEAHTHHLRARTYWDDEARPEVAFCRITQMAFLRLLTNRTVMGDAVLTPAAAWKKEQQFQALREVQFFNEPAGLELQLGKFCDLGYTSPNLWTDAYLASFARCARLRLVTFDHGFSRFQHLDLLVLDQ